MHAMKASNLALAADRVEQATENALCNSPARAAKGHVIDWVACEVTG